MNAKVELKEINELDVKRYGIIYYIISGILVGAGGILPAFSGGSMAVALNIYDIFVQILNECILLLKYIFNNDSKIVEKYLNNNKKGIEKYNFFQRIVLVLKIGIRNYAFFLIPFIIGAVFSVVFLAKLIHKIMEKNEGLLIAIFLGLMLGTIPQIFRAAIKEDKEEKTVNSKKRMTINIIVLLLTAVFVFVISILEPVFSKSGNVDAFQNTIKDFLILIGLGVLIGIAQVIPGISGMLLVMICGKYKAFIYTVNNFDILKLLFCLIGVIMGTIPTIKLMDRLLKKQRQRTYFGILGFIIGSMFKILLDLFRTYNLNFKSQKSISLWIGMTAGFIVGYALIEMAEKLTKDKNKKDEK